MEDQAHFRNEEDVDLENDELLRLINMSNPRGEDFMKWAKNQPLPSYNEIMYRLDSLKNKEAVSNEIGNVCLNDKQMWFRDIVHDWVKEWVLAKNGNRPWPKALRLFLMGSPGAGKSTCVKATMDALGDILGVDYKDLVRQVTPTGCASFQMSAGATTVHKLFGLHVKSRRTEIDEKSVKMLCERFKNGLCLLVLDESTMESRGMIAMIISRLRSAGIDPNTIGIILIGDPAQLLPIGGEPFWSIKMKRMDLKDFSEDSYMGLVEFRELFRMGKLEQVPDFDLWKTNESLKNPTEKQRKQISEFTARALEGDYDAVFLSEIKRGVEGDQSSFEFTSELVPSCRYGKIAEKNLLRMREVFATPEDVEADDKFLLSRMLHGYHYFTENDPNRKSVKSDNIRTMLDLAKRLVNKPIVHLKSIHMPVKKCRPLKKS